MNLQWNQDLDRPWPVLQMCDHEHHRHIGVRLGQNHEDIADTDLEQLLECREKLFRILEVQAGSASPGKTHILVFCIFLRKHDDHGGE